MSKAGPSLQPQAAGAPAAQAQRAGAPAVHVIVARARNGVIGRDGRLPWHLPQDLARFKRLTSGCPVIMGRHTWQSLPEHLRPLPGRRNIVLSSQPGWSAPGAQVYPALADALQACAGEPQVWIIGGARLYAQALPLADRLEVTEIDADVPGDVSFPAWERDAFVEVGREVHRGEAPGGVDFAFITYQRKR